MSHMVLSRPCWAKARLVEPAERINRTARSGSDQAASAHDGHRRRLGDTLRTNEGMIGRARGRGFVSTFLRPACPSAGA